MKCWRMLMWNEVTKCFWFAWKVLTQFPGENFLPTQINFNQLESYAWRKICLVKFMSYLTYLFNFEKINFQYNKHWRPNTWTKKNPVRLHVKYFDLLKHRCLLQFGFNRLLWRKLCMRKMKMKRDHNDFFSSNEKKK